MGLITQFISTILAFSLLASPAFAVTNATSSATSTSSGNNGGNTAVIAGLAVGAGILGASLISSSVGLRSFGGRILTILPCVSPLGPSLWITIAPAGVMPVSYIWTPATITKLAGPPSHPGQQVLGLADTPFACWNVVSGGLFGLLSIFTYHYGLRMTVVGTSPL